ncbi:MAG: TldD/PmbA family protein, partial [Thaumarchaeota archaeon]|nr:TldD/PmbA family protein [Nitrososphaerota archaeon]
MNDLEEFAEKAILYANDEGCQYCDVRAEVISERGVMIENGEIEYPISKED